MIQPGPDDYRRVKIIAGRLCGHNPGYMDDAIQDGMLGLLEACEKYQERLNATFASYSWAFIKWRIKDGMRNIDPLSRSYRRCIKNGRADSVCFTSLDLINPAEACRSDEYMFNTILSSERLTLINLYVESLPADQRLVFRKYYYDGKYLSEIGCEMGFSERYSGMLLRKALERIKRGLRLSFKEKP